MENELKAILTKLDHHTESLLRIERQLERVNGTVKEHGEEIAILKVSCLRLDAIKISAIIGGVVVVIGALMKIAGLI